MTTALLVIDVQQALFSIPGFPPHEGGATVQRIRDLIHRARDGKTPVFFVQHDGGSEFAPIAKGSPGFAIRPELAPRTGEHVTVKTKCNSFQGTDLDTALRAAGAEHLIVCGMQTEFCVDTAVRAAFERGYKVTLVEDGHTTGDTKTLKAKDIIAHHNATLGSQFAKITPAAEIAFGA